MQIFQHILVVTNGLLDTEIQFIRQAIQEQPDVRIKLSLIYLLPEIPLHYFNLPSMGLLEKSFKQRANETLTKLSDALNVPNDDTYVLTTQKKAVIEKFAKQMQIDLILAKDQDFIYNKPHAYTQCTKLDKSLSSVIGTHLRHGGISAC